jgi:hypothetical protein
MSIEITLNQIRERDPCRDGWGRLLRAKGETSADDEPFPLSDVLDSNGLGDCLWCLRCLPEHDRLWRKYNVWCARQVEHLMTDERSKYALEVSWRHSDGLTTDEELSAARAAAGAAALDAAWDSARAAARAAAWDAARAAARAAGYAAWAAARAAARAALDAAWDAGDAAQAAGYAARDAGYAARDAARAAMRYRQAAKLRQILTAGEWVND